jgi:hypothetical protein
VTLARGIFAPGVTNAYGVNGGAPYEWQSGSVITVPNPASTNFALALQAGQREGVYPDLDLELHVRSVPIDDLAFDPALAIGGLSSVATGTIEEDHRAFFRVEVPAEVRGEPVVGWRLSLESTHGKPLVRVRSQALPDDRIGEGTSRPVLRQAVIVPEFLEPGVWFVEVLSGGLTSYRLTSEALRPDRPLWTMPAPGEPVAAPGLPPDGRVFGDSGLGADGVPLPGLYTDLEQDSFHYYAIRVPDRNAGLLRTELIAYNGDPNLYLRRGLPPSVAGWTVYDRALTNAVGTEYGHWVPLDRKSQTLLEPGLWYLAVHAAGGANVRYRLMATAADILDLPFDAPAGSEPQVLAAGDWRHFRIALPVAMTEGWQVALNQIAGDVALYLRDTVPAGHGTNGADVVSWRKDGTNHGPYPEALPPGVHRFAVPPVRPGATYYLGVRALTDARFSLASAPVGSAIALTGVLPFADGEASGVLPAGGVRRYRVDTPPDGRWFRMTGVHPSSVRFHLDQGTIPTVTSADHWVSFGANASIERALYDRPWPWVAGHHYFLTVTNLSPSPQAFGIRLEGRDCSNDDFDQDGLPDCWESQWFGSIFTYGPESDPDRDGVNNLAEYLGGQDPTSAGIANRLEITGIELEAAGTLVLEVEGTVGRTARIEASASLAAGGWVEVMSVQFTERLQRVRLPSVESGAPFRFFRVTGPH